ncbi:MAG: EFR1 family ferrodoxin [Eubacteriales bacterium]|nr:EFR1 family ferrodoxin [Eubacteriales bacterium]
MAEPLYNRKVRRTVNLRAENTCIGCGLCAPKCPVDAIEMRVSRPVWVKDKCVMCLGCLHRCSRFAIQYGKNTKKHGQYTHPNVQV